MFSAKQKKSARVRKGSALFACCVNYLINVKFGVIVDVEAACAIRQGFTRITLLD
jgi:hypothetical protein